MPLIARGVGSGDKVKCVDHGKPPVVCGTTLVDELTNECSPNVFVVGTGVVRNGDLMLAHMRFHAPPPICDPHEPPCDTFSPNVYANTLEIARKDDTYFLVNNHIIMTPEQSTVFANGA